jgi:hypothetical protein
MLAEKDKRIPSNISLKKYVSHMLRDGHMSPGAEAPPSPKVLPKKKIKN